MFAETFLWSEDILLKKEYAKHSISFFMILQITWALALFGHVNVYFFLLPFSCIHYIFLKSLYIMLYNQKVFKITALYQKS